MLRVFKPQSPMSMGSWVLTRFSTSAGLSSLADFLTAVYGNRVALSFLSGIGRIGSVAFGMPFHNYTGVLLAASVIPVWNNRIHSLPREFGMSGLQSAVSLLELTGETDSAALNAIGLVSAGFESWEGIDLLRTPDRALLPAKRGGSGALVQIAGLLSGPVPIALRIASLFVKNKRRMCQPAALSGIAGSLLMRYGWVHAGTISARDWKIPMLIDEHEKARLSSK
jgi:hypothetical protein